jgi:hypothetical protein
MRGFKREGNRVCGLAMQTLRASMAMYLTKQHRRDARDEPHALLLLAACVAFVQEERRVGGAYASS